MNNQNTIEKMKQMRLSGMAQMHHTNTSSNINLEYTIDQFGSIDVLLGETRNRKPRPLAHFYLLVTT